MTQGYNTAENIKIIYAIVYQRDPSKDETSRSNFPTLNKELHKYSLKKPQFDAGWHEMTSTCYFFELNLSFKDLK